MFKRVGEAWEWPGVSTAVYNGRVQEDGPWGEVVARLAASPRGCRPISSAGSALFLAVCLSPARVAAETD